MNDDWFEKLLLRLARLTGLVWEPRHLPLSPPGIDEDTAGWELAGDWPRLPGWHMIELNCECVSQGAGVHYMLEAKGMRKTHILPLSSGRMTKRLIYLPYKLDRLYLKPVGGDTLFRITHHRLNWIPPQQAHDRLAQRLAHLHPGYRDCSKEDVLQRVRELANDEGKNWREFASTQYEATFLKLCSREHYRDWIEQIELTRLPKSGRDPQIKSPVRVGILLSPTEDPAELGATLDSLPMQQGIEWVVALLDVPDYNQAALHAYIKRSRVTWVSIASQDGQADTSAWHTALRQLDAAYWMSSCAGDRLSRAAAILLWRALRRQSDTYLLYSDDDELDASGQRRHPRFKPQWNPDLLMTTPYIGRMALYRTDILQRLLKTEVEPGASGAELEYALSLGLLNLLASEPPLPGNRHGLDEPRVAHLHHPLYHRRTDSHESETLTAPVHHHLVRAGHPLAEVVAGPVAGTCRVYWPVPDPAPLVSLIIPTRDRVDILKPCVQAILEYTDYSHLELLILDNQSTCPETLAYLEQLPGYDSRVRVLHWDQTFNYSAINNFGVRQARGTLIGLVNNDIEPINPGWLREMVAQASRPEIGCVGAKLYYPNDTVQHAGVILGIGGIAGHGHRLALRAEEGYMKRLQVVQNLSAVTAACLLVRKAVFEEVGGFNESHLKVALNDVDLCLKVREAGYRNLWTPYAELYHYESVSRGQDDTRRKRLRAQMEVQYMRDRWAQELREDPAYNPNLSLVHEDFSLR